MSELVLQNFELLFKARGMSPAHGRVFGALVLSGKALTQRKIVELTGYSLPAICIALDDLVRVGLVSKTKIRGKREKLYKADSDMRKVFHNFLINIKDSHVAPFRMLLQSQEKAELKKMEKQLKDFEKYLDRLIEVRTW